MARVFALTFAVDPEDVRRLRVLPALRYGTRGRTKTWQCHETYFDTPGRDFLARRISVRVEDVGHQRSQIVTYNGLRLGPAIEHRHWQGPVPTHDPALAAVDDAAITPLLAEAEALGGLLEPVFTARLERTERHLERTGAHITMHIDTGTLEAGSRNVPLHQLTLTLESGPTEVLLGLTHEVVLAAGLLPSARTLAARGFEFADARPPLWAKQQPLGLTGKASAEEAMILMLRSGLDQAQENAATVLENDHPEGIHQMRVGLRRTRSALRLHRKLLPPAHYAWLNGELRWITSQLGPARDMDVFEDEILAPVIERAIDQEAQAALATLHARVKRRRTRCRAAARKAVKSDRYRELVLEVGLWLARRDWRAEWGGDLPALLDKPVGTLACRLIATRHKAVHKDGSNFHALEIAERHQLRIDVKKLRYAIDFFGTLYPGKNVARYLLALEGLQDGLGYLNDVAVAQDLVQLFCRRAKDAAGTSCRLAGGMVIGWHTKAMADIEANLSADVAAFLKVKPFWNTKKHK